MTSDADLRHETVAACLTPPGAGGIAVVRVAGPGAARIASAFLQGSGPVSLESLPESALRVLRWVEDGVPLDDVVVSSRRTPHHGFIVDINLHGGMRIVQRVLLALNRAGVLVIQPAEMARLTSPAANALEREIMGLMPGARTRAVALWLIGLIQKLPGRVEPILADLAGGHTAPACDRLAVLIDHAGHRRFLLSGVRVAIVGSPNVGKSTLANALGGEERAIVSELPGTTRDWIEHDGAIDGVPFTFVDTAGLRQTDDPIEREAIGRGLQQIGPADVVVEMIDLSAPPCGPPGLAWDENLLAAPSSPPCSEMRSPDGPIPARLFVWNKTDLPEAAGHRPSIEAAGVSGCMVSARTGDGLERLKARLLVMLGLENWRRELTIPVTDHQIEICRRALSALDARPPDGETAIRLLRDLAGFSVG
jgi:tRNA modification GTPase